MNRSETSGSQVTNGKAIASLTFGILSLFIPFIGLVLSIMGIVFSRIAVREITNRNEDGRGLATAGLVCSIVGVVFQLFAVIGLLSFNLMITTN